ncbi:MAG: hypothetical protein IJ136_06780 [Erysipelotrichaceae bacterium]|nr:hypothetical protein [Erysipelotrichaceae bacterium]
MNEFEERYEKKSEELHYLYQELYHDENAYAYFVSMLRRMYEGRSEGFETGWPWLPLALS